MYSDRRGNGQKPLRTKPSTQKTPDKTPWTKTPWTIERKFVQGAFLRVFYTRSIKNRGGVRDVWRTFGGSRDVWQSVTGGQNWPKIAWRTLWTAPEEVYFRALNQDLVNKMKLDLYLRRQDISTYRKQCVAAHYVLFEISGASWEEYKIR